MKWVQTIIGLVSGGSGIKWYLIGGVGLTLIMACGFGYIELERARVAQANAALYKHDLDTAVQANQEFKQQLDKLNTDLAQAREAVSKSQQAQADTNKKIKAIGKKIDNEKATGTVSQPIRDVLDGLRQLKSERNH